MRSRATNAQGIGSKSFEDGRGVALSPRLQLDFDCAEHHHFSITFSSEAALPSSWDCPHCWGESLRSDGVRAVPEPGKVVRTPWQMLRERRSLPELEAILAERLALLEAGTIGPGVPPVVTSGRRDRRSPHQ